MLFKKKYTDSGAQKYRLIWGNVYFCSINHSIICGFQSVYKTDLREVYNNSILRINSAINLIFLIRLQI